MSVTVRPHRSLLFMPGSNARALEKGKTLAADGLVFDLEDAVSPNAKEEARRQVCAVAKPGGYGRRQIQVRVNALATPWGYDDIVAASVCGADAILLPKVEDARTVRRVEAIMEMSDAPKAMAIWCMIETPAGVLGAGEISRCTPRLGGLVMGTSDLAKELRCAHTRERLPMIASLGMCLLAARAAGISIVDGVHLDLDDDEGFAFVCEQGREFGFDGKALIHPKQIGAANRAFSPTPEEIAWSRKVIDAHAEAEVRGEGVVLVDGKLIENLHVVEARRLVALADSIDELAVAAG